MIVEFSILLLLLLDSCSAVLDSNNQDEIKRSSNRLAIPHWRLLQRNRKVMHQLYAIPRIITFMDPSRPLIMQTKRPYLYNFDS